MSVTTFFEKMIGLQQQRSQQKQNSYRELVAGIATGEEPSAAEVDRILAETKKSISDLKHDVETYQHRMALKAIVVIARKNGGCRARRFVVLGFALWHSNKEERQRLQQLILREHLAIKILDRVFVGIRGRIGQAHVVPTEVLFPARVGGRHRVAGVGC